MAIERRSGGISEAERLNLDALTASYEREDAEVPAPQRVIELVSTFFGSPAYFVFAVIFIIAWISINLIGVPTQCPAAATGTQDSARTVTPSLVTERKPPPTS